MDYISDLTSYKAHPENMRLNGFKILNNAGLRTPSPIKVVTPTAFDLYREKGITSRLSDEITGAAQEVLDKNPQRGIIVRRAIYLLDPSRREIMESALRSQVITKAQETVPFVEKIFKFADRYYKGIEEAEITAFIHPLINPGLRPGGHAYVLTWDYGVGGTPSLGRRFVIRAVYGNDESHGVSDAATDIYSWKLNTSRDARNPWLLEKRIGVKTKYLDLSKRQPELNVPKSLQHKQIIPDEDLTKMRSELFKAQNTATRTAPKNIRVEFNYDHDGRWYTELAWHDYGPKDLGLGNLVENEKTVRKFLGER